MYFVPEKGRIYRWAVYKSPIYRYALTCIVASMLLLVWFYLIRPLLAGSLQYRHAAHTRSIQQQEEMKVLKQKCETLSGHITRAREQSEKIESSVDDAKQLFFALKAIEAAGLHLQSCTETQRKTDSWCSKMYRTIVCTGTIDQCLAFLEYLSKNDKLIQCSAISLQAQEQNQYILQCQLQSITKKCEQN